MLMKRILSTLALLGTFFLLPFVVKAEEFTITINQVEHCNIKVTRGTMTPVPVNSGDKVPNFTMLTIKVTPDEGYQATHYIINGEQKVITSSYGELEIVDKDMTISAVVVQAKPCTITIEQPEHGTLLVTDTKAYKPISSGSTVNSGTGIRMEVTPDNGCEIEYWLINGKKITPSANDYLRNSYTYVVKDDVVVSAKIKAPQITDGKITMIQPEHGSLTAYYISNGKSVDVIDGATLPLETEVTFHVTPATGYEMDYWLINNVQTEIETGSQVNNKTFTVEGDLKVQPVLKQSAVKYTITMIPPKPEEGKLLSYYSDGDNEDITNGMSVEKGAQITFRVVPAEGYEMDYWLINDKREGLAGGTMNNYKAITVESDLKVQPVLKAKAAPQPETVLVKVSSEGQGGHLETKYVEPNGSGNPLTISGDKRIPLGSVVTVKAKFFMPGDYQVVYTNNGNAVPTEELSEDGLVYTFIANEDADVHAVFSEKPAPAVDYTVTFEAGKGGTVTATVESEPIESGAKIPAGTMIKILPTPDENYEVDQCLSNGDPVDDMELGFYYVKLLKDTHIKVTFRSTKPVEYVVTVDPVLPSAEAGTVQLFKKNGDAVESGMSVVTGTEMYVAVKPADKYELESLQVNNTTIKAGDEALVNLPNGGYKYVFTVTEATTIQATFKQGGAVEQLTASQIVAYVTNGGTRLEIAGATEGAEVRLYDYTGQLLLSSTEHALDISALPAGSYIVLVGNYTTRIVK